MSDTAIPRAARSTNGDELRDYDWPDGVTGPPSRQVAHVVCSLWEQPNYWSGPTSCLRCGDCGRALVVDR